MKDLITATITFIIANYPLTFLVTGLVFSAAAIGRAPRPAGPAVVVEKLLSWYVFFAVGVYFLYNFVMHVFFGGLSAKFIGWADSPFQFEVGTASLGFAVIGFIAAFRSFDLRLAAIVGPGIFQFGAAAGHVYQMMTQHNFAPGNAGVIFYMDIIIPLFGLSLLWLQRRSGHDWRECRASLTASTSTLSGPSQMTFSFLHSTLDQTPISIPAIGLDLRVRVPPQSAGGTLSAIETTNQPGFGPPLHRHRETEIFYVLEGRYLFEVDGKRFHAETGDVVTVPGGAAHAFVNTTNKAARQYILIVPGLDAVAFFTGLGNVIRDGRLDPDRLNAFGKSWDVEFLGPPIRV